MPKAQTPKDDENKFLQGKIQKQYEDVFVDKNTVPSPLSMRQVEDLQARIAELEARLEGRQTTPADSKPDASPMEPAARFPSDLPARQTRVEQQNKPAAAPDKRIIQWIAGISVALGLTGLAVGLYTVFVLQRGTVELSIEVLTPYSALITIANLIGLFLARRNRPLPGAWIAYLTDVIIGPVLVVLVSTNLHFIMGGYLVLFSFPFIILILPRTSRWWASLAAVGAVLAIAGIEIWNPAFRAGTSHTQNFALIVLGLAVLGFSAIFIMARQIRSPRATNSLTAVLSISFFALSAVLLLVNGGMAAFTNYINYQETLTTRQVLIAQDASKTVTNFIEEKYRVLETAGRFENSVVENPESGERVLGSLLGLQPAFRQAAVLSSTGQQIASMSRQSSSLSPQFESYLTEEVLAHTKAGQRFIGNIYIENVTSEPQVVIAVPIQNSFGEFQGVLAVELNLKFMWDLVDKLEVGQTGYAYVVDYRGNLIAFQDIGRVLRGESVKDIYEVKQFLKEPWYQVSDLTPGLVTYKGLQGENVVGNYVPLGTPVWAVITELPVREAYQPLIRFLLMTVGTILIFGILAGLAGNFLARRLSAPLTELSKVATEISSGNLGLQAKVSGPAEIAQVASTFNAMTSQLHDLIGSLEQRVSDRTHDLELAADVGRTVGEKVTELSEMLTEAAEIIRARFDLYYTQIYLTDPSGEKIVLRAGTGEAGKELLGRMHSLPINSNSLNGRAVLEKQAQIIADTQGNPNFLPNPLLPDTRSEMAIPLVVGEKVVGVLDMQSERVGALNETNLPAFQALAGQLAVAIQNASLFSEVQEARAEVEAQVQRFTEQGWQDFLNAIQHGQRIGFEFDNRGIARLTPEELTSLSAADRSNIPMTVTGAQIGTIQLPADLKPAELELAKSVGAQLTQHLESLRLLAQAEQYRLEAEQTLRRLTHEGWDTFLQTHENVAPGYVFDLAHVKPLAEKTGDPSAYAVKRPMAVGDQVIGELAVDIPNQSQDAAEVLEAVAEQLSAHIENLRLSELNERHAQREQTLRQITSVLRSSNDPATIMRTAVRELGTIMGRRTVVQLTGIQRTNQAESPAGNENKSDAPANQS